MAPGLLTAVKDFDKPGPTDAAWVLDLPAAIEKSGKSPEVPTLRSYDRPAEMVAIPDRTVTVPYTMLKDAAWPERDRVISSPFYQVQRKRYFKVVMHRDNRNGSETADISDAVTIGVTEEQSKEFSMKAGITVGWKAGVSAPGGIASAESSVSLSLELGYSTRSSVTTLRSETKNQGMKGPATEQAGPVPGRPA